MSSKGTVYRGVEGVPGPLPHPVVAIGNFDGVHRGHQRILQLALDEASKRGGTSIALTFRPHPQVALRPESAPALLSTYDEKIQLLRAQGVDLVVEQPFSREFSTTKPEQFFNEVILRGLNAEAVVVGYDFAFGARREGHLDALAELCARSGVQLFVVEAQRKDGEIVSSTRIRQHLVQGDVESAAQLLGREFFYRGVVIKGDGRGRQLGFPTANLRPRNKLALPRGVYVTEACVRDSHGQIIAGAERCPSVTNIGVRPTFQSDRPAEGVDDFPALIETHLLDRHMDLYGLQIEVRFIRRLRDERKFDGIQTLVRQIQSDIASARLVIEERQKHVV